MDGLICRDRLVEMEYYAAVVGGLIEAAECVEATLALVPHESWNEGLSLSEVSKRLALDDESVFLEELAGSRRQSSRRGGALDVSGPRVHATMLGLLYVYVGSGLGGLHLLRVVRTAQWWQAEREHLLLHPYGEHLHDRWRAVLNALARLDADATNAAVVAARAGFELHRESLVDHLSIGGGR
ncbi:hypothetical protein [Mycobacterium sp. Root135]|uniref:hypothetical protein n=1 Tax=Mycobacterium sp. Root135 TaxID=1736457 RepID=UPI0012EAC9D7|nr:hypothetical protein [Mycobacterium sp. Root135]